MEQITIAYDIKCAAIIKILSASDNFLSNVIITIYFYMQLPCISEVVHK